jgi:RNA polymerase sigma-70 factor (ECF subfamily)
MLRVFTKINSYSATGEFDAWVFRIVKNSLYNHYRLSYQKPDLSELQEQINPENPVVLRKLYYEDLLRLLKLLPSQSSKVFRMYAIEGYSHKEIAARLGISVGTSKWHVFKAKEKLIGVIDFNAVRYG